MRTLNDIVSSHRLFWPNPQLAVSARYPGHGNGHGSAPSARVARDGRGDVVVLLARLALVLVLCDAVEHLTGSPRAGGFAVAVYAVSAHFVSFNSQFAYESLALPFALAAVAFIARARWAADPRPLFGGATVCLLAVAVTHHLTSWLTALFCFSGLLRKVGGQARRRVFYGAIVAAVTTAAWGMTQWSLLRDYFGPMIDDLRDQLSHREQDRGAFHDSAGWSTPLWERAFLLYYSAALALVVSLLVLVFVRWVSLRLRSGERRWEPRLLLVVLAAMIPALMAARVMPKWERVLRSLGQLFVSGVGLARRP